MQYLKNIKDITRKLLQENLSMKDFETLRIYVNSLNGKPPIIIYTAGKVGSTTVYQSLKRANLGYPIYHIHHLTESGIRKTKQIYKEAGKTQNHRFLKESEFLKNAIKRSKGIKWKIITLVREPIRTYFSKLFHEPKVHYPYLIDKEGKLKKKDELVSIVLEELSNLQEHSNSSIANWFEEEFRVALGISLYEFPFDDLKGYQIIEYQNFDILVLRLEDLNKNFQPAIHEFLKLDTEIPIYTTNVNDKKKQSSIYQDIISNIKIPKSTLEEIYSSEYTKHFYAKVRRQQLLNKWSGTS